MATEELPVPKKRRKERRPPRRPLKGNGAADPQMVDGLDQREMLAVVTALKKGDFSVRLPETWTGTAGRIASTLNDVIEMSQRHTLELERISRSVGKEGKIHQRVRPPQATNRRAKEEEEPGRDQRRELAGAPPIEPLSLIERREQQRESGAGVQESGEARWRSWRSRARWWWNAVVDTRRHDRRG